MRHLGGEILGACRRRGGAPYLQIQSSEGKAVHLWDVKKTSTGNLIILLSTYSQNLLGLNLSAYTDGSTYFAHGLLKVDPAKVKNDGSLDWLLGSCWFKGKPNDTATIICHPYEPRVVLDENDYAYFMFGPSTADSFVPPYLCCYKINTANMSYVNKTNGIENATTNARAQICYYDGYIYTTNDGPNIWDARRRRAPVNFQQNWQGANGWDYSRNSIFGLFANANGFFCWDPSYERKLRKSPLNVTDAAVSYSVTTMGTIPYNHGYRAREQGTTSVFLTGTKGDASNTFRCEKRNQSNGNLDAVFTPYEKAFGAEKTHWYRAPILMSAIQRYVLIGYHNDGAVGTWDPAMISLDSVTGEEKVGQTFLMYSDGEPLQATASKTMAPYGAVDNGDGTAWVVGYLNTALRGYANEGGINDGFLVKLNVATGRIIDQ